jgi:hypothetical protein
MSARESAQSIEHILQMIFDGREDEARSAIGREFGQSALEQVRLLPTVIAGKANLEDPGRRDRVRLANLFKLSIFLTDNELWDKAVTALAWTINLSVELDEHFFLEDSRFQKAFCHKMLGQTIEMLKEKKMISANRTFFVGDKDLGLGDLD